MSLSRLIIGGLLATALAAPTAFAQNAGAGNGNGAGNNGVNAAANTNGNGNGNANGNGNGQVASSGAILTVSPSAVREVQQALNRLGYSAGPINGLWDQGTADAMVHFQQAHGLEPTGNLNLSSIAALGLWNNIIGNPVGNGNQALTSNNGSPPQRGGNKSANIGGAPIPSQRLTTQPNTTVGAGGGANGGANGAGANGAR